MVMRKSENPKYQRCAGELREDMPFPRFHHIRGEVLLKREPERNRHFVLGRSTAATQQAWQARHNDAQA
jgi:hypothetical protein